MGRFKTDTFGNGHLFASFSVYTSLAKGAHGYHFKINIENHGVN